ncbi:hypothetical protein PsorP6_012410 [Peronosclerospora sorghi]|uniref:Uncharacterized protein n=1 Tax=Peronosclerospora sorghi TaxID=230839 RepID=A0ACC0WEN9_9STRA|nr:hypothetical protein PsorP6_012410 [Peronosclerospora sorghi]
MVAEESVLKEKPKIVEIMSSVLDCNEVPQAITAGWGHEANIDYSRLTFGCYIICVEIASAAYFVAVRSSGDSRRRRGSLLTFVVLQHARNSIFETSVRELHVAVMRLLNKLGGDWNRVDTESRRPASDEAGGDFTIIKKNLHSFIADQTSTIEVAIVVKGIKGELRFQAILAYVKH